MWRQLLPDLPRMFAPMSTRLLSIGALSERTGASQQALKYYEQLKLLESVRRGKGARMYSDQVIDRVRFIRCAQGVGFSLEEIQHLLALLDPTSIRTVARHKEAADFLRQIDEKQVTLAAIRVEISGFIATNSIEHPKPPPPDAPHSKPPRRQP